jgi:hypothetical protein
MYELLAIVIFTALLGGLLVFPALLLLAKLGYFEPVELQVFGKTYLIAPKQRRTATLSNAAIVMFPARQVAFASVVTVVLSIAAADGVPIRGAGLLTGSAATSKTLLRETA